MSDGTKSERVRLALKGGSVFCAVGLVIILVGVALLTDVIPDRGSNAVTIAGMVGGLVFFLIGLYMYFVAYYFRKRDHPGK